MPKSICKFDFSDVDKSLRKFDRDVHSAVAKVGQEAVDYAVEHGNYQDRTGNLRRSNTFEVDGNKNLEIRNEAEYASYVESKGFEVVSGAALYAESRLKEIFGK